MSRSADPRKGAPGGASGTEVDEVACGGQTVGNVVIALDGSPAAATAFSIACPIAAQLGTGVEVLHVATGPVEPERLPERLHIPPQHRSVPIRVEQGDPVEAIIRVADDPTVPLLVLTTHGREIEGPNQLTSVALAVASRAKGPILLVRPEIAAKRSPTAPIKHFLVPIEGSPRTAAALRPAIEPLVRMGGRDGLAIDLLHVAHPKQMPLAEPGSLSPPLYIDQPHLDWPAWQRHAVAWLRECCQAVPTQVPMRVFVTPAAAAAEVGSAVAAFAAQHGEDVIVVVRRSHLEPGRAIALSQLLERTSCPVLLVGAGEDDAAPIWSPGDEEASAA